MIDAIASYASLFDLILFNTLLAFSQYIVLRAGVFSLGTAAFAALGAYAAALATTRIGLPTGLGITAALLLGAAAGGIVAIPLARLRGVFQAIATLALVQLVLSGTINAVDITNGALGINGIPKTVGTFGLLVAVAAVLYVMTAIGGSSIGRAFDVIRQDETVAVALGISVPRHHMIAFILSGAIAGLAGGLHAYSSYSITPNEYGFHMLVTVLAMVVLGGRRSVLGPFVGAVILTALPELVRDFANYGMVVQGVLLMLAIVFMPLGVADTLGTKLRARRLVGLDKAMADKASGKVIAR